MSEEQKTKNQGALALLRTWMAEPCTDEDRREWEAVKLALREGENGELQALRAELAALREAHRWRYPPEMPPKPDHYSVTLAWYTLYGEEKRVVRTDQWDGVKWVEYGDDVVAWRPLPEPAPRKETT